MVMLSGKLSNGHASNLNYDLRRLFVGAACEGAIVQPSRPRLRRCCTIEDERADKGTTGENSFHELMIFFILRLNAQDDQTNWARVVYDRSKLNPKRGSAELLAKCTELYQSSLHR